MSTNNGHSTAKISHYFDLNEYDLDTQYLNNGPYDDSLSEIIPRIVSQAKQFTGDNYLEIARIHAEEIDGIVHQEYVWRSKNARSSSNGSRHVSHWLNLFVSRQEIQISKSLSWANFFAVLSLVQLSETSPHNLDLRNQDSNGDPFEDQAAWAMYLATSAAQLIQLADLSFYEDSIDSRKPETLQLEIDRQNQRRASYAASAKHSEQQKLANQFIAFNEENGGKSNRQNALSFLKSLPDPGVLGKSTDHQVRNLLSRAVKIRRQYE